MIKKWSPAVIFFVLSLSLPAWAEPVVFVFEEYPPYEYTENGDVVGFDTDTIREVCKRLNITPEFQSLPWNRALLYVKNGRVDAIFSLFRTPEREEFLFFPSSELSREKNVLFANAGSGFNIKGLDDLKGKTIGVCSGYSYGETFDNCEWMKKDVAQNVEMLFKKQIRKRTDLVVINELVAESVIKKLGIEKELEKMEYVVTNDPLYVGFSKAKGEKAKRLAEDFSTVLQELRKPK